VTGVANRDPVEVPGHRRIEVEAPLLGESQAGSGREVLADRPDLEQRPVGDRVAAIGVRDSVGPRRHEFVARRQRQRQAGTASLAMAFRDHPVDRFHSRAQQS